MARFRKKTGTEWYNAHKARIRKDYFQKADMGVYGKRFRSISSGGGEAITV